MQYPEFVTHVQTMAQLSSDDEAQRAIRATLETLAERIQGNEASQLAAQLPEEISTYLQGREGQSGEPFSLQEFYQRVAQKEEGDPAAAVMHVRAVFSVLNLAVSPGEFSDVQANLSHDYEELFATPTKE